MLRRSLGLVGRLALGGGAEGGRRGQETFPTVWWVYFFGLDAFQPFRAVAVPGVMPGAAVWALG